MPAMNRDDTHREIERVEAHIDDLETTIESCRKFILAGRIAIITGAVIFIAALVGGIQFNPSVMGIAAAAILGGIVAIGSNHSTAKEASRELAMLEAERATLIGQLDLRIVPDR